MLAQASIVCLVATKNPKAARHFYEDTLGLRLTEGGPFALVFDANGVMLRIQKVRDLTPAQHTALGLNVADIRSEIAALSAKGIVFQRFDGMPQDEQGIWKSPAGVLVAWFSDPDGNLLSLAQWSD